MEFIGSMYQEIAQKLLSAPKKWLVTGAAGFIGSHLVERLLRLNQTVVGLDNFATGFKSNIERVLTGVSSQQKEAFTFIEGDIRNFDVCKKTAKNVDFILHQAALGSVPRSIEDPAATNDVNVGGFVNLVFAAKENKVSRFIYASSSSVYGDNQDKIKVEERAGTPLSPYAVSKKANELYAATFSAHYSLSLIGLRYFNVFGPRQNPHGVYAAVIPRWISNLIHAQKCTIYGDGETSRDFCYIENVVQANILAVGAKSPNPLAVCHDVYNVACGESTSLNALYKLISKDIIEIYGSINNPEPSYCPFRPGDIKHSLADCSKAKENLGYHPPVGVKEGIKRTVESHYSSSSSSKLSSSSSSSS